MWPPLIVVSAIGAFLFMDNLSSARSSFGDQLVIARRQQTWVMSFLYIGTFGSFVGYSAAFPLLLKTQFPAVTASLAFLGPLVGSLSRPLGGLLSDKIGGAPLPVWGFVAPGGAPLGGFFIPRALGASITATGGATTAFGAFFICYIVCVAVTWWYYLRSSFLVGLAPSLAHANA